MSIAKPFTFVAGQKARANEVNADFDTLYSQVNTNIADIAQINRDVDNMESTKANINGNSTQRFAVANPVNSTDAVNKQTLNKSLTNVLDFINGLTIEKDSNSPDDTILVNPGSCYDSTKQVVLELSNITSKQNINQGANTTYYVYIIGNETGSSTDIIISNSSVEPTLPTGYTKFRNIGRFTTDSNNKIDTINSYSSVLSSTPHIISTYTNGYSGYIIWSNGYCEQWGRTTAAGNPSNFNIVLFKTMKDSNYFICGSSTYDQTAGDKCSTWSVQNISTSGFTLRTRFEQRHTEIVLWKVSGYLAEGEY